VARNLAGLMAPLVELVPPARSAATKLATRSEPNAEVPSGRTERRVASEPPATFAKTHRPGGPTGGVRLADLNLACQVALDAIHRAMDAAMDATGAEWVIAMATSETKQCHFHDTSGEYI
jgi:hypothetical protein